MYDIKELSKNESKLKENFKNHFINFFTEFDYFNLVNSKIKKCDISSHEDMSSVRYGSGLYLILTNYMSEENPCSLEIDGLKVIYRGHGRRIKKRVESHIFNDEYNNNKDGTVYSVCMKLDDNNGININQPPYCNYSWAVIQHPMTDSSKTMREQAEQAFDHIYSMPIGSNA